MGKVACMISITPDGFADSKNVIIDPGFLDFSASLMSGAATLAFGRTTFEMFQERWPGRMNDEASPPWIRNMAALLHDIPKLVFSSRLHTTTWNNSTIVNKLDAAFIRQFKVSTTGSFLTFGSLSIVETMTAMNVVDDYYFNIQPLLPGGGDARFFSKLPLHSPHALTFIDSHHLSSGAHIIHYKTEAAA